MSKLNGLEKLETALERSKRENRGLMTVMNHMNGLWGALIFAFKINFWPTFSHLAKSFQQKDLGWAHFQGSIDASIRLLSPDDTLDLEWTPHS
nr:BPK_HP1_G0058420.mRNA.1.CDS.1 [Saccharomyces cerevisiae]